MMPSSNICFQIVSVLTIPGSFHLASPVEAFVHRPGCTEFAIDCSVSWSKPSCAAPCTKQPTLFCLSTWHTCSHSPSVVGGVRLYFWKMSSLIQSMPAYTEPTDIAVSLPVGGEAADADRRDLRLPVAAERLLGHRGQVLGERLELGDVGAGLHVEDVRALAGGESRAQRGRPSPRC